MGAAWTGQITGEHDLDARTSPPKGRSRPIGRPADEGRQFQCLAAAPPTKSFPGLRKGAGDPAAASSDAPAIRRDRLPAEVGLASGKIRMPEHSGPSQGQTLLPADGKKIREASQARIARLRFAQTRELAQRSATNLRCRCAENVVPKAEVGLACCRTVNGLVI